MHNGPLTIALNLRATLPDDHPIHYAGDEQPGLCL